MSRRVLTADVAGATWRLLLLAGACYATGLLGVALRSSGSWTALVWLPTGIAVAGLYRWGRRYWPAVSAAAVLLSLSAGTRPGAAIGFAVGRTLGPLVAVAMLRRFGFHPAFERQRDVLLYCGTAGCGTTDEIRQQVSRSRKDCLRDWGDERSCPPTGAEPHRGGHGAFFRTSLLLGPRRRPARDRRSRPLDPGAERRADRLMRRLDRAHDADEFSLVRRLRRLRPLERAGWLVETLAFEPRPDCVAKLEAQGLASHDHDHYGREDACDRFSAAEIEAIEAAMRTLHLIGLHALNVATATGRLAQLGVPQAFSLPIGASPARGEFSLAGRLDRAYNGRSAPKPLEYNSDTPTSLLESAVCLRYWLKDRFPEHDPCNSLRERPVECWKALPGRGAWRRC